MQSFFEDLEQGIANIQVRQISVRYLTLLPYGKLNWTLIKTSTFCDDKRTPNRGVAFHYFEMYPAETAIYNTRSALKLSDSTKVSFIFSYY